MTNIVLFTLDGCIHCKSLKDSLTDLSIPFTELEVNQHPEIWDEVVKQVKYEYFPTVFVTTSNDNGHIYIPSIDYETEEEIIEIIKSHNKKGS